MDHCPAKAFTARRVMALAPRIHRTITERFRRIWRERRSLALQADIIARTGGMRRTVSVAGVSMQAKRTPFEACGRSRCGLAGLAIQDNLKPTKAA